MSSQAHFHGQFQSYPPVKIAVDDCAPSEFVQHLVEDRVDCGIGKLEPAVAGLEERVERALSPAAAGSLKMVTDEVAGA